MDLDLEEAARQLHELNGTDGTEECTYTLSELRTLAQIIEELTPDSDNSED